MTTPVWQAGTTYVPGAIVQPVTGAIVNTGQPSNNSFKSGSTGWTLGTGMSISASVGYDDAASAEYNSVGEVFLYSTDLRPVNQGQSVSGNCMIQCQNTTQADLTGIRAMLVWYKSDGVTQAGTSIDATTHPLGTNAWYNSPVSGTAPSGAAYVAMGARFHITSAGEGPLFADNFTWNYSYSGTATGLMYEAVQAAPAKSGTTEPTWPTTVGATVVDNGVTWKCVQGTLVEWQAAPINISGATEPTWPTTPGGVVNDNGVTWVCSAPNVQDPNCPNTPQVIILSSKVFAANKDITSFCATNNPLDWSTLQDAGFLPTGFQSVGETYATALGQYRGQLAVWTGSALELWQTDPDPAQMGLTDTFEGGGTPYYRAQASVSGDLFYLSPRGVRAVSVTAGTGNMEASTSAGLPIDVLVLPAIQGIQPIGIYYPGLGQYWLICGTEAFVLTVDSQDGPSWSRYTFPTAITGATVMNGLLYLRDANNLYVLDEDTYQDNGQNFEVTVQWPWQDLESAGVLKQLIGFDIVHSENVPMFAVLAAVVTTMATFDPNRNTSGTLSSRNTVVTQSSGFNVGTAVNANKTTGKWYVEFTTLVAGGTTGSISCEVTNYNTTNPISYNNVNPAGSTLEMYGDGTYRQSGVSHTGGPVWGSVGGVIGIAFDADARQIWARDSTGWAFGADPSKPSPFATLTTSAVGITDGIAMNNTTGYQPSVRMNAGESAFAYSVPPGFAPLSGSPSIVAINGTLYANLCNLSLAQSIQSATVTGVTVYGYGNTGGVANDPGFTNTYDDNCSPQISAALSPAQTDNPTDWTIAPNPAYPNFTLQGNYADLFVHSWNLVNVTIQVTSTDGTVYTCNVQFTELVP